MKYILVPLLEDIALIKVAILLWNPDDIRTSMARSSSSKLSQIFVSDKNISRQLENKILDKIPNLLLHMHLKRKLETFVKMIGLQILSWLKHHCAIYFCTDLPNEFCWTPFGKIDYKKTAGVLIKDESIDITSRYILACIYCLQDDTVKLWNKIPENRRKPFYSKKTPREVRQHRLVVFWTYVIKNELMKMDSIFGNKRSPYQYAFEIAAEDDIMAATQYFLQKLTSKERKESLIKTARQKASTLEGICREFDIHTEHCIEVLCFLLSQTDEQQQMKLLKACPYAVLNCFLHWPRQRLFMETAKHVGIHLSAADYEYLLKDILYKVSSGYKDYNYRKLFEEFWQQSQDFHKKFIIDIDDFDNVISDLFDLEDVENIKLVLESATVIEREQIIFSHYGKRICSKLLERRLKYLLKFFIGECIFSKNEMNIFKKELLEYLECGYNRRNPYKVIEADSKILFCQLMDELIGENDKISEDVNDRISEDENDRISEDENDRISEDENCSN